MSDVPFHEWANAPADEAGDAIVAALTAGGVEYLFFTSGSEIVFFQESIAKANAQGRQAPKIVTMVHEHAGLNAALGYAVVSGKPVATVVHVDAGTLNHGGAIHTAGRSGLPIIMLAGAPPTSYPGSMRGARDIGGHIWAQQTIDQNSVVRPYVKWDHRLEYQDNPGLIVSRALQVALSEPTGPVYLSLPREIVLLPVDGTAFPTVDQLGIASEPWPDPSIVEEIVDRLLDAEKPVMVVAGSRRSSAVGTQLVELCERAGIRVVVPTPHGIQMFPMSHPLFDGAGAVEDADVVIVLDARVPWLPGRNAPPDDAYVVAIGVDPIQTSIPTYEFTANRRLTAGPNEATNAILTAFKARSTAAVQSRIDARRTQTAEQAQKRRSAANALARERSTKIPIDPLWLSHQIGSVLDDRCVVFDDTLGHNRVYNYLSLDRISSYYSNPGTSGGWAVGAAFGAKLADPARDMIAVTGDGFYMFATPNPVLWAANHNNAPFMTIVYQNRSYTTGTAGVKRSYASSYSEKAGFNGGYFDPPIDFTQEAQAAGAYAETVNDPAEIAAALQRGLAQVRAGRCAVISVWLARILMTD